MDKVNNALKVGDLREFLTAVREILKSQDASLADLSANTHISREHLHKLFRSTQDPRYRTISNIIKSMGYRFTVTPAKDKELKITTSQYLKLMSYFSLVNEDGMMAAFKDKFYVPLIICLPRNKYKEALKFLKDYKI